MNGIQKSKNLLNTMKDKKEIYFYPAGWDGDNRHGIPININGHYHETYIDTEMAIRHGEKIIHTTSMAHFHFDLLDLGYDIYVRYNGKKVKVEPGMDLISGKELKRPHNIRKIFIAHAFDEDFGIDYNNIKYIYEI